MLITLGRGISQVRYRLFRFYSVNSDNVQMNENWFGAPRDDEHIIDQSWNATSIRSEDRKLLRIAIIGMPNAGKSTLVNQLVDRPICGVSEKVQTTKVKCDAVYVERDTQLIFIDTPGLVTNRQLKKYKLDMSFRKDINAALHRADIIGVIQDASHHTRAAVIDQRVLAVLKGLQREIPSLLILNKVDRVTKKTKLLEIVPILTGEEGWPHFSDVFMVSALKSDGIGDLRQYLMDSAKLGDWQYEEDAISSESPAKIIERAVHAKFMDNLPDELPYTFQAETEHLGELSDGSMSAVVAVTCPNDRLSKIMMGRGGERVKTVALLTEQELCQIFRTTVRLKVAIKFAKPKQETGLARNKK